MADRITGLYTLTIGETPENTLTVFNANPQTAAHWLEFWYAEAKDGRFKSLTIEENGTLDHSPLPTEATIISDKSHLFRVQTWRSVSGKLSIVHSAKHLSNVFGLISGCLEHATKEGIGRLTKVSVTLAPPPVKVPVRTPIRNVTEDVKRVAHAVLRLSDPFGDWSHVQEVVTPDVMSSAERLSSGL